MCYSSMSSVKGGRAGEGGGMKNRKTKTTRAIFKTLYETKPVSET